jgi:hypothetical protein
MFVSDVAVTPTVAPPNEAAPSMKPYRPANCRITHSLPPIGLSSTAVLLDLVGLAVLNEQRCREKLHWHIGTRNFVLILFLFFSQFRLGAGPE